jgi:ankyrin repeat protein
MIGLFLNFPQLFNRETHDKKKPIDIAIEYNDPKVIRHFFDRSHIRDVNDMADVITIENVATCSHENEVVPFRKEQYEEVINHDHSILSVACRQLHGHNMVSHLINPNSIMYRDKQTGLSPLMVAVQYRQLQCVKELLNHKYFTQEAFELVSNVSFRTVLHICSKVHNKEITKILFESRFMSNALAIAVDLLGNTPLHTCAQVGNVYMTQLLLSYSIDHSLPITTFSNSPPLLTMINRDANRRMPPESSVTRAIKPTSHYGLASRHAHAMLIKKNKGKLTPLHVAIQAGNLDVIREMLKYADPSVINVCDDQQRTSLHIAAAKGEKVFHLHCERE